MNDFYTEQKLHLCSHKTLN